MKDTPNKKIGRRLTQLRSELAGDGETAWPQVRLAEAVGLSTNQVARLEQSGAGSVEAFVTVLLFYNSRGYNLNWIMRPDNSTVSKLMVTETMNPVDLGLVQRKAHELKQVIDNSIDRMLDSLVS
jgi:hypothetical protein